MDVTKMHRNYRLSTCQKICQKWINLKCNFLYNDNKYILIKWEKVIITYFLSEDDI